MTSACPLSSFSMQDNLQGNLWNNLQDSLELVCDWFAVIALPPLHLLSLMPWCLAARRQSAWMRLALLGDRVISSDRPSCALPAGFEYNHNSMDCWIIDRSFQIDGGFYLCVWCISGFGWYNDIDCYCHDIPQTYCGCSTAGRGYRSGRSDTR